MHLKPHDNNIIIIKKKKRPEGRNNQVGKLKKQLWHSLYKINIGATYFIK